MNLKYLEGEKGCQKVQGQGGRCSTVQLLWGWKQEGNDSKKSRVTAAQKGESDRNTMICLGEAGKKSLRIHRSKKDPPKTSTETGPQHKRRGKEGGGYARAWWGRSKKNGWFLVRTLEGKEER